MRVVIAGSRSFSDYNLLKNKLDHLLQNKTKEQIEIVSGTARGADLLGERYAREKGYKITRFPADWEKGKKAGYIRNKEMAKYATHAVIFWDGKSKGTRHMINLAKEYKLNYRIVKI
jgi:hypothetical protein